MVKRLRRDLPEAQIIAGNVASSDGARELSEAGAIVRPDVRMNGGSFLDSGLQFRI